MRTKKELKEVKRNGDDDKGVKGMEKKLGKRRQKREGEKRGR
jgi:hypothetical protein